MTTPRWPYPDLLAHRGGGRLAPENTLSALVAGALFGSRMAEFDVRLSRDNVPFLLSHTEYVVIARPSRAARNKPGLYPVNLVAAQDGFFGLSPYHA